MSNHQIPDEMEEVYITSPGGHTSLASSGDNVGGGTQEFINQMEDVFKAIDKNSTGIITLGQLRDEIEELGSDTIDSNPLIGQLINYLKIVHYQGEDVTPGEELDPSMIEEERVSIDFDSFVESMTGFVEGVDPKESRRQLVERNKLPRFKVPIDMLRKYNITPKGSPLIQGVTGSAYSHTSTFSPSKNKFGKMYSAKPVITFDQFEDLFVKLNHGNTIPKNKLLMFVDDLPQDGDGCIDISSFIGRYSGLNHPMSPKLTFEDSDLQKHEQAQAEKSERSSLEWSKNTAIMGQLQENYKTLEKECDTFQSEIAHLEKARQQLESNLKKRETEIDRLKRDAKFVDGMRDSNKDLVVQNTNLKTTISKLTQNDASLRDTVESEKERGRILNEQMMLKDLEIKKLNHLLKTQQTINNKLSMMVTFSNEVDNKDKQQQQTSHSTFRIKPTFDRAKQLLTKQKSEFFDPPVVTSPSSKSGSTSPINTTQQTVEYSPHQPNSLSLPNSPAIVTEGDRQHHYNLQQEFEQIQQEQQDNELDQLKQQLFEGVNEISLPSDDNYEIQEPKTTNIIISNQQTTPNLSHPSPSSAISTSSMQSPLEDRVASTITPPPKQSIQSPLRQSGQTSTTTTTTSTSNTPNNNVGHQPQHYHTVSPRSILVSPTYVRQSSPTFEQYSKSPQPQIMSPLSTSSSSSNQTGLTTPLRQSQQQQQQQPIQQYPFNYSNGSVGYSNQLLHNSNNNPPPSPFDLSNAFSPLTDYSSNTPNGDSIKRMKKSDLIRLHTNELEAHQETAQSLINETAQVLAEMSKNKNLELQRVQKMYQEEKQANKFLEKQLSTQIDKNKELVSGHEKNAWGGMQGFFSFVAYFLPASLLCNVSSTS